MTDTLGFEARFAPELKPLVHPIDSVKPHPDNIRVHNLPLIQRSLARFGQQTPLTVQKSTNLICKGNGTWQAAKSLGWTEIAYHVEEFDDDTALLYLLADNRASDFATNDAKKAQAALLKLESGPGIMDSLWTQDDLDDLGYQIDGAKLTTTEEFKGGYADSVEDRPAGAERVPGQKMREVPLVLSVADHAEFIERLRALQKIYGTTGTVATIIEAVKREASTQEGLPPAKTVNEAIAAVLQDLEQEFKNLPPKEYRSGVQVAQRIQLLRLTYHAEEPVPAVEIVPGQETLFPDEAEA
jgi:hypothetical protein